MTDKIMAIMRQPSHIWAALEVCAAKPDWSLRLCIDYRALNAITQQDMHPMPRVDKLVGPTKFIDLSKGYYQVPLEEEAQRKITLVTPLGKFQFTRLPFGLRNAPAAFQRIMGDILQGLNHKSTVL